MGEVDWLLRISFLIQSVTEISGTAQYMWLVSLNLRVELFDRVSDHLVPFMGVDNSEDI